jgi:hypothetical protein
VPVLAGAGCVEWWYLSGIGCTAWSTSRCTLSAAVVTSVLVLIDVTAGPASGAAGQPARYALVNLGIKLLVMPALVLMLDGARSVGLKAPRWARGG